MSSAKITLFTFANYLNQHNDDLFKLLTVPSGIDKDILTEIILLRGGEFEVLYSDPIFMQYAIGTWSKKWQRTMQKWIDALSIDYNPLENYDRYEQWEDVENKKNETERLLNHNDNRILDYSDDRTVDNSDDRTFNSADDRTLDYSDDRTIDTQNSMLRNLRDAEDRNLNDKETRDYTDTTTYDKTIITEKEVSAYDSSSYQPSEKTTETDSNGNNVEVKAEGTDTFDHTGTDIFNHTGTENVSNSGTDNVKHSGTDDVKHYGTDNVKHYGTDNVKHSGSDNMAHTGTIKDEGSEDNTTNRVGHVHGNIGVTTSQQMLESELSLAEWNIYEHITDLFLTEFIIPIYT